MSDRRRQLAAAAAVLLLLGSLLLAWRTGWLPKVMQASGTEIPASRPAASGVSTGMPTTARQPLPNLPPGLSPTAEANPPAGAPPKRPAADIDDRLMATIEQQWCSHYALADAQMRDSIDKSHPMAPDKMDEEVINRRVDAIRSMPTAQARQAVQTRVVMRWIEKLDAAGDPLSAAIAASLVHITYHEPWDARVARVAAAERRALTAGDAAVAAFWASGQVPCEDRAKCQALAQKRWQAIEPGNLFAWLETDRTPASLTEPVWQAIAQSQYARSYGSAAQARLLPLLPLAKPGLEREEALALIERLGTRRTLVIGSHRLLDACRTGKPSGSHAAACMHAAELLWNADQTSMMARIGLLGFIRDSGAQAQGAWPDRIASLEQTITPQLAELMVQVEFDQDVRNDGSCSSHSVREERLRALVDGGPLKALELAVSRTAAQGR